MLMPQFKPVGSLRYALLRPKYPKPAHTHPLQIHFTSANVLAYRRIISLLSLKMQSWRSHGHFENYWNSSRSPAHSMLHSLI